MKNKPRCETVLPWLKANLGNHCLGCLTGYSARALAAAVQIVEAWTSCDSRSEPNLIQAFRAVVITMDEPERQLAYHSIAHIANWEDRERLWALAELPAFVHPVSRCKFE